MSLDTNKKLNILHIGAEAIPYANVGGISMVIKYLSKAMKKEGHDVRIFIPKYGTIDESKYNLSLVHKGLKVPTGYNKKDTSQPSYLTCNIKSAITEDNNIIYFLENMEYYEKRSNVYGYSDDHIRWALLCYGALKYIKEFSDFQPDIIHIHDWHTALVANIMKTKYLDTEFQKKTTVVLTIHNMSFQGISIKPESDLHFDDGHSKIPEFYNDRLKELNFLKRGIIYADIVNTVSEGYAKEILTESYGVGLHKVLQQLRSKLYGIVNGIDYEKMNPETDPNLASNYNIKTLDKRLLNKLKLQEEFSLEVNENIPVFGSVGRLEYQKGIDLTVEVMQKFLRDFNVQFVLIGGGDASLERAMNALSLKYPKRVGVHTYPNFVLPRLVFSGADIMLMPSRFEPCGIVQLESLRYGAVVIARDTGGLRDTVLDFDPETNRGTGFKFKEFDGWSLYGQMVRAIETYKNKKVWRQIQTNAMTTDFSWESVARKYLQLYSKGIYNKYRPQIQ